jgi:predicted nucleic acid-binding protein
MYLIDTDVISEARKGDRANVGVKAFFRDAARNGTTLFLSVITIGELRQGVETIRHRGDGSQASRSPLREPVGQTDRGDSIDSRLDRGHSQRF